MIRKSNFIKKEQDMEKKVYNFERKRLLDKKREDLTNHSVKGFNSKSRASWVEIDGLVRNEVDNGKGIDNLQAHRAQLHEHQKKIKQKNQE